jgi:hypothetical protein
MTSRRQQQVADWGATLEDLAGLDGTELRRVVEDNPAVAELVGLAWEEAARTAAEGKRTLLARVAASALRGDATPGQVDALRLLLRTVIALDPSHITLLVRIGQSIDGYGKTNDEEARRLRIETLAADWPGPADLLGPLLAGLERESLIQTIRDFGARRAG